MQTARVCFDTAREKKNPAKLISRETLLEIWSLSQCLIWLNMLRISLIITTAASITAAAGIYRFVNGTT